MTVYKIVLMPGATTSQAAIDAIFKMIIKDGVFGDKVQAYVPGMFSALRTRRTNIVDYLNTDERLKYVFWRADETIIQWPGFAREFVYKDKDRKPGDWRTMTEYMF